MNMRLAPKSKIYQVNMPPLDICNMLTSPAFRDFLKRQGSYVKLNMEKAPFCLFIRSEMIPIIQYLNPDTPSLQKLQSTLLSLHPVS